MNEHQHQWNERYRTQDTPWETGIHHQEMTRLFIEHIVPGEKVLDIGCGLGTNAQWLARQGYQVTGIDISPTAIKHAQQKAQLEGLAINYVTLDFLHEWQRLAKFKVVFDCAVFHLFKDEQIRRKWVQAIAQVCEDDGYWINISCSQDHADEISSQTRVTAPPHLSAKEMIAAVDPDFEIIEIRRCEFTINRMGQGQASFNAWGSVFKKR
jgi:2-polyprenyl-3-methyl-5-hydroxy-6-metoxy-1,4-benzoquinol methylase